MHKKRIRNLISIAIFSLILIAGLYSLWHNFINLPRLEAAKKAKEEVEWVALKERVFSNFDNYLKVAPMLNGQTEKAFNAVVNEKIHALHIPRFNDNGMTSVQKWRESQKIISESDARIADAKKLIQSETKKCSAFFDVERCQEMIETWHCTYGDYCTELAAEVFDDAVHDRGYISEDDLDASCKDVGYIEE
jgi:hypothetical protein